jgi:hypothetical protein
LLWVDEWDFWMVVQWDEILAAEWVVWMAF